LLGFGTLGHVLRLSRAGFVLAREGAFVDLEKYAPSGGRFGVRIVNLMARRGVTGFAGLANAIDRLGPSYVKLGQFLSTRPDIVGTRLAIELEKLQDRVPPQPREVAVAQIEEAFGQPIGALFFEFGEAVAAASVAQVHRAKVRDQDGQRDVAVKVLRPGVERRFARDLSDMAFAARLAERLAPELRRLRLSEVVATLERSVRIEMDLRLEAAAASEFGENVRADDEMRAPAVDWDRTTREVFTMGWMDGEPIADPQRLAAKGHDPARVARALIQSFLRHALRDGFFHADMHQGNVFVDESGRIVVVDFGIMGRLGRKERRFLAEILYGFITRDYLRVAQVHFDAGYVPKTYRVEDFAQAIRAIGEPIHSRTADRISMAKLLTLLFEVTALFDMSTRLELVMLQKTMVVVEGVARKLDPHFNMWAIAEPVVGAWIANNLGVRGRAEEVRETLASLARVVTSLPGRVDELSRQMSPSANIHTDSSRPIMPPSAIVALWLLALAALIFAFLQI